MNHVRCVLFMLFLCLKGCFPALRLIRIQMASNVEPDNLFEDFIPLQPADQASCRIITCDIGGVSGNYITDHLSNRIVSFCLKRIINIHEDVLGLISGLLNWLQFSSIKAVLHGTHLLLMIKVFFIIHNLEMFEKG